MVLYGKALQNICFTVTFTQGQGKKVKVKGQINNNAIFLETIKDTIAKFGTMVLCDKMLKNMHCTVTFTQGKVQRVKVKGQINKMPFFLGNNQSYSHQIWYNGTLRQDASKHMFHSDFHPKVNV